MALDPTIAQIIKRCQRSPSFFIDNFCKVKHPKLGILSFKLFSYQKKCLKDFLNNKYNVFRKCRQVGISTLTGAFALWYGMFFNNKTVLIVSKRDDDAKEYLARNVKFAYLNLPQWMQDLWKPQTFNEHTLAFANGSSIKSLTSSPDTLRSNASSLNIIDEAAFIPSMEDMWAAGYSTLQHGGSVIIVSCVPKGTYVFDKSGLTTIDKFIDDGQTGAYNISNYDILGKDRTRRGNLFYNSGIAETKQLIARYGEVEGSSAHKLWACKGGKYNWYKLEELNVGDWISIQYGQEIWGDNDDISGFQQLKSCNSISVESRITPELAYFIGLYLAEGNCYVKRNKHNDCIGAIYAISCGDDIGHVFNNLGLHYTLNKDDIHYNISSKNLYLLLEYLGIDHTATASKKTISPRLLQCSRNILGFILRGLFDGDGGSRSDRGSISYTTTSKELYTQIRLLLNNMGMIASHYVRTAKKANQYLKENPGKCNAKRHNHDLHLLELDYYNSNKFYKAIEFGLERKQNNKSLIEHVTTPGDSHDLIPNSLDFAHEMFDATPFGAWTFKKKYDLSINPIVSKKTRYKTENLARKTMLKMFKISKPYLTTDQIDHYNKIISQSLRWVKIIDVKKDYKEVYDFSLPDNKDDFWAHSVVYNGFLGHQTPHGIGNWYWKTWAGAIDKQNDFNPIIINWWDMDWELKFEDELSGLKTIIAPTKGIKTLTDPHEIEKYGPGPDGKTFWSPWLEGEYRNLATKGDDSKFRQEVLAEFIGSGNTVLSRIALSAINQDTNNDYVTIGTVDYINPAMNDHLTLDFQDQLWVWEKPYTKEDAEKAISAAKLQGIDPKSLPSEIARPHTYVVGADTSTGEADDYSALQVIDIMTQRQVAELKIKVLPKQFARMIDYVGRMYNNAHVVCERTGIGQAVTSELDKDLMYPNLYRHSKVTATLKVKYNQIGYPTSHSTKPVLIKHLVDNIGVDGYEVRSTRLYHECCIYIHLGSGKYGNEPGIGNTDDLVMSLTLALVGVQSALMRDNIGLMPINNIMAGTGNSPAVVSGKGSSQFDKLKGKGLMLPMGRSSEMYTDKISHADELAKFTLQVGQGITLDKNTKRPLLGPGPVTKKKHILKYFK